MDSKWQIILTILKWLWEVPDVQTTVLCLLGGIIVWIINKLHIKGVVTKLLKDGAEHTEITDKLRVTINDVQKIAAKSEPGKKGFTKRFQRKFRKLIGK